MKNKKNARSFSYLDVFLILVLFLILSFVIYHFTEKARLREKIPDLLVELSAEAGQIDYEPKNREALYRESGEIYGSVLEAKIEERGSSARIRITCRMQGIEVAEGDLMRIETSGGILEMRVDSVSEIPKEGKGGS